MKKILVTITIAAIFAIAPAAMAGGTKVPKSLCLAEEGSTEPEIQLVFKAIGTMKGTSGKRKLYTVIGHNKYITVSGSAWVKPNNVELHATFSGMELGDTFTYELASNLEGDSHTLRRKRVT